MANNYIWVTFQQEGMHHYKDAPTEVWFLWNPHRHIFHFKAWLEVFHDDRDVEFIMFKRQCQAAYTGGATSELDFNGRSCEMLARELAAKVQQWYPGRDIKISVSEDNENGCELYFPKPVN